MVNSQYSPALQFDRTLNTHLWHNGIQLSCDSVKNIDSSCINAVLKCTLHKKCLKSVQFATPL